MKNNPKRAVGRSASVIQETVGWLGILAIAGLTYGAWDYVSVQRETARANEADQTMSKILEIAQINGMIRTLSDGHPDDVKQSLSLRLAEHLLELRSELPVADENTRVFGQGICDRIVREARAHPESYLSAMQIGKVYEGVPWQHLGVGPVKPASNIQEMENDTPPLPGAENN